MSHWRIGEKEKTSCDPLTPLTTFYGNYFFLDVIDWQTEPEHNNEMETNKFTILLFIQQKHRAILILFMFLKIRRSVELIVLLTEKKKRSTYLADQFSLLWLRLRPATL